MKKDMESYLKSKKSISESLESMAKNVKNIEKSIWLIHQPPANIGFDICANREKVGSSCVNDFIEKNQPLLTLHGHIHESPEYNGFVWGKNIGKTVCLQAGQLSDFLFYVTFDVCVSDNKIINLKHSVYSTKYEN
jgi:uncharacterized protein